MTQLDKDLNTLSNRMDKAYDELNSILVAIDDVEDHYDLFDYSSAIMAEWQGRFADLAHKLGYCFEDFETFAFDGDSIRESGEDEEEDTFHNDMFEVKK